LTNFLIDRYFDFPDVSGFVYSSVRQAPSEMAYGNFAIKPDEVDRKLKLASVKTFRVEDTDVNGTIKEMMWCAHSDHITDDKIFYAHGANGAKTPKGHKLKPRTRHVRSKHSLHFLDLRRMDSPVNRPLDPHSGSQARIYKCNGETKLKCPNCGFTFFVYDDSKVSKVFSFIEKHNVPVLGKGLICPKCKEAPSWSAWKEVSQRDL
jgi:hypothetical protein